MKYIFCILGFHKYKKDASVIFDEHDPKAMYMERFYSCTVCNCRYSEIIK